MSQICELTGIKPQIGNKVSHANNKNYAKWHLNIKKKRYFVPELSRTLTLNLSTRAIRTIDKFGSLAKALVHTKEKDLSPRLQKIQKQLFGN